MSFSFVIARNEECSTKLGNIRKKKDHWVEGSPYGDKRACEVLARRERNRDRV